MKKIVLAIILVLSNTVNCFASAYYPDKYWDIVAEKIKQLEYSGIYVDGDYLYVKTTIAQQGEIGRILGTFPSDINIRISSGAKYTISELEKAKQKAMTISQEFQLSFISIDEQKNGLSVGSYEEWTDERKSLFIENVGIETIFFYKSIKENEEEGHAYLNPISPYIARLQSDGTVRVRHIIYDYIDYEDSSYGGNYDYIIVPFENIYMKNGNMMIPVKESIDKEMAYREIVQQKYTNMTAERYYTLRENKFCGIENMEYNKDVAVFTKEKENKAVITFQGKRITAFENQREGYLNGQKIGFYEKPDITENDIFLSVQDFNMLFGYMSSDVKRGEKEFIWRFSEYEDTDIERIRSYEKQVRRICVEYLGNIFWNEKEAVGNFKNQSREYDDVTSTSSFINVYEKNNHMMIAVKDIERFASNAIKAENTWDTENNTVSIKLWGGIAKDIVFTKDSNKMLLNDVEIEMEEVAEIQKNRMYIPITALFEILEIPEQDIVWIEKGKNVIVRY